MSVSEECASKGCAGEEYASEKCASDECASGERVSDECASVECAGEERADGRIPVGGGVRKTITLTSAACW